MTTSAKLRGALSNPRVLALGLVGTVAAVYLIRNHGASSSSTTDAGTPLPVSPGSSTDPFFTGSDVSSSGADVPAGVTSPLGDPVVLDPGQTLYDPTTGAVVTAPSTVAPADTAAQQPGPSGVQPAPAPRNKQATTRSAIVRRVLSSSGVAAATRQLGGSRGHNAVKAPSAAAHAIDRINRRRPTSGHPASRSNVTRQAHTISGAKVVTAPHPTRHRASGAAKKTLPMLDSNHVAAATNTGGTIVAPAAAVKAQPAAVVSAVQRLFSIKPSDTPRRATVSAPPPRAPVAIPNVVKAARGRLVGA